VQSWALWAGARLLQGTFLRRLDNSVNNREGGAGRRRQFALAYGVIEFQGYKNRIHSQNKAKDWWSTHLDEVRYDPTAEVEGSFNSCSSSKRSAVSAHTGLPLTSPRFEGELQQQPLELTGRDHGPRAKPHSPSPCPASSHPPLLVGFSLRCRCRCRRRHRLRPPQGAARWFLLFACASQQYRFGLCLVFCVSSSSPTEHTSCCGNNYFIGMSNLHDSHESSKKSVHRLHLLVNSVSC